MRGYTQDTHKGECISDGENIFQLVAIGGKAIDFMKHTWLI